ncbi:Uncharacterised protein [Mycobacterium tuberculosis]|nr:Uncharacterised protein [Mycobacterium tuberculosis]
MDFYGVVLLLLINLKVDGKKVARELVLLML